MIAAAGGTRRTIRIGGLSKAELRRKLEDAAVALNAYAEQLFASDRFETCETSRHVDIAVLSVGDLGLPAGGTMAEIVKRAAELGLQPCLLELGPHFRLQFLDQPEADPSEDERPHQAPPGSITVVSEPLIDDDDFPKGFYLRCIDGVLWLRGYVSGPGHIWQPDDRLAFVEEDDLESSGKSRGG